MLGTQGKGKARGIKCSKPLMSYVGEEILFCSGEGFSTKSRGSRSKSPSWLLSAELGQDLLHRFVPRGHRTSGSFCRAAQNSIAEILFCRVILLYVGFPAFGTVLAVIDP